MSELKLNSELVFDARDRRFSKWAKTFHKYGCVILNNGMTASEIQNIRQDLDTCNNERKNNRNKKGDNRRHRVHKRFFEKSNATYNYIKDSILTEFARYIIRRDVPVSRPGSNSLAAHLIHCNAFSVPPNGRGQAPSWHMDDPCHNVILTDEHKELPKYVKLPILGFTAMCWLSDVPKVENGPTHIIPGSHRFGKACTNEEAMRYRSKIIPACGNAGTLVLVNSQLWHRGAPNTSKVARDTLQISYGRRYVSHFFGPIIAYDYPEWIKKDLKNQNKQTNEIFGYLQGGAYS